MRWMEWFGYGGALLTLATFSMRTMLPLRAAAIAANVANIVYGSFAAVYPVLLLHLCLLPLNLWRLQQLLRLSRDIREAAAGPDSIDWLKPFTRQRPLRAGETVFRRGDPAGEMLFVLSGTFLAVESDVRLARGEVFGELGLILKGNRRSQTVVCETDGVLLQIAYDEVRQIYFQDPKFGFYFLELVAQRLRRDARAALSDLEPTDTAAPAD